MEPIHEQETRIHQAVRLLPPEIQEQVRAYIKSLLNVVTPPVPRPWLEVSPLR
jgi:hypothetical protein